MTPKSFRQIKTAGDEGPPDAGKEPANTRALNGNKCTRCGFQMAAREAECPRCGAVSADVDTLGTLSPHQVKTANQVLQRLAVGRSALPFIPAGAAIGLGLVGAKKAWGMQAGSLAEAQAEIDQRVQAAAQKMAAVRGINPVFNLRRVSSKTVVNLLPEKWRQPMFGPVR